MGVILRDREWVSRSSSLALLLLAACGSKDQRAAPGPRDGGDASIGAVPIDAAAGPTTPAGTVAPYLLAPPGDVGELTVHVEWKEATTMQRGSPGRDPCGAARPPYARVHTLHGVADVVVWLDLETGKAPPALTPATIIVRACRLEPTVQIAARVDASLIVRDLDERRVAATIAWADALTATPPATTVARAELAVVGDAVTMPLGKPWLIAVESDASSDPAYLIVPPHPYVALTDDTGAAVLAEVSVGTYPVHAWLRAAAGEPARLADGTVTVEVGVDASVTLTLATP